MRSFCSYSPLHDFFFENTLNLLDKINSIHYYHLNDFYNDIAMKIIFFINIFFKPYFYLHKNINNRFKYYVNFHVLHIKKVENFNLFVENHKNNYSADEDRINTE